MPFKLKMDPASVARRERYSVRMSDPDFKARKLATNKEWQRNNPEKWNKALTTAVRNVQKASKARRDAAAGPKPERCPICLLPFTPTGPRKAVWDHNHRTGKFRGWICCFDNRMLGMVQDSPDTLRRAALYIETDEARNPALPWQKRTK